MRWMSIWRMITDDRERACLRPAADAPRRTAARGYHSGARLAVGRDRTAAAALSRAASMGILKPPTDPEVKPPPCVRQLLGCVWRTGNGERPIHPHARSRHEAGRVRACRREDNIRNGYTRKCKRRSIDRCRPPACIRHGGSRRTVRTKDLMHGPCPGLVANRKADVIGPRLTGTGLSDEALKQCRSRLRRFRRRASGQGTGNDGNRRKRFHSLSFPCFRLLWRTGIVPSSEPARQDMSRPLFQLTHMTIFIATGFFAWNILSQRRDNESPAGCGCRAASSAPGSPPRP